MRWLKNSFFGLCCGSSITLFTMSLLDKLPLSIYGIFVFCYFVGQITFSLLNIRKNNKYHKYHIENGNKYQQFDAPTVSILVIGYRENVEYWKNCLNSVLLQKYHGIENIIISSDGCNAEDLYMGKIEEE